MKNHLFIFFILLFTGSLTLTNAQSREIDKTFTLEKNGSLELDNYKGSINIETWDKAEVEVHVKIEADGWGRKEEEKVEKTEIIFRDSKDHLYIKTEYPDNHSFNFWGNNGNNPLVHYTIKMPATVKLDVNDYKSDTDIRGLHADLNFETYKGTVKIVDFSGAMDLETYKGDVEVDFTKLTDDCKFETFKGRIEISLAADTKFSLDADLGKKGDFDSEFDVDNEHSRRRHRNDDYVRGDVNGGGPYIEFSTYKGDLRLMKK
jgi:DUF4097 and DUF4098 domain-containing protein YvlB